MATPGLGAFVEQSLEEANAEQNRGIEGFDGDDVPEVRVRYDVLKVEKRYAGKYNSHIILGRDRIGPSVVRANGAPADADNDPLGRKSGYGMGGIKNCSSIDLVAGIGGIDPKYFVGDTAQTVKTGPNFFKDAARVYISQKTDVDEAFNIGRAAFAVTAEDLSGPSSSVAKSAVAIKADCVRLVARKNIKITTGTDTKNSKGESITKFGIGGIWLMAGNDQGGLQPLVKGDNMLKAMSAFADKVDGVRAMLTKLTDAVRTLSNAVSSHQHNSPFFGALTGPPANGAGFKEAADAVDLTVNSMTNFQKALANYRQNYLTPGGSGYINSALNKTN